MIDISGMRNEYQDREEITWLLERIAGVTSLLEVGSAEGQTMRMFAHVAAPGAKLRSVDIAYNHNFNLLTAELFRRGYDVEQLIDDSQSGRAIEWARQNGPYEFIFIDGDHGPTVVNDWNNYGPMATRFVGFHDISVTHPHVRSLWLNDIKPNYQTEEFIVDMQKFGMGFVRVNSSVTEMKPCLIAETSKT